MSNKCQGLDVESYRTLEELLSHQLFKSLGDPNRIRLLLALVERCRTCSVSELAECLTIDLSVVSRHLAMLRAAGVLRAVKQGKQVYYAIQYQYLAETLRGIADALEACEPALTGETSEGCESQEPDG
jgi:ArsR family transcriptional regulator